MLEERYFLWLSFNVDMRVLYHSEQSPSGPGELFVVWPRNRYIQFFFCDLCHQLIVVVGSLIV